METGWAQNPSRRKLEWGIGRIHGGLKNQPHRFRGDFEKPLELYYRSDHFFVINLILGYIFENRTQNQKRQMVSDKIWSIRTFI